MSADLVLQIGGYFWQWFLFMDRHRKDTAHCILTPGCVCDCCHCWSLHVMLQLQPIVHTRLRSTRAPNDHWLGLDVNARFASLGHSSILYVRMVAPLVLQRGRRSHSEHARMSAASPRRRESTGRRAARAQLPSSGFGPASSVSAVPQNDRQRLDCSARSPRFGEMLYWRLTAFPLH